LVLSNQREKRERERENTGVDSIQIIYTSDRLRKVSLVLWLLFCSFSSALLEKKRGCHSFADALTMIILMPVESESSWCLSSRKEEGSPLCRRTVSTVFEEKSRTLWLWLWRGRELPGKRPAAIRVIYLERQV
jgi:hypothetical protein